jgi:hypothetical protein
MTSVLSPINMLKILYMKHPCCATDCCQSGCEDCPYDYKNQVDPSIPAELLLFIDGNIDENEGAD